MISSMTQNKPAPVYFNEPLSMGQRQCEKFFYSSLLKKVSEESNNKLMKTNLDIIQNKYLIIHKLQHLLENHLNLLYMEILKIQLLLKY